jgi:hypothetical protein
MDQQPHDFNVFMQKVIDNTETWTCVRADLISRIRDSDWKLPPKELWELQKA